LALNPLNPSLDETSLPSANLQILNGENIGKIITIRKKILQIGRSGSGIIVITKRKDGYFVSILENIGTITLNDAPINDSSLKLNNNDILVINNRTLQFFLN
ncbi:MAG: FHA domain-containing protein, partial [Methylosarcina sp.]